MAFFLSLEAAAFAISTRGGSDAFSEQSAAIYSLKRFDTYEAWGWALDSSTTDQSHVGDPVRNDDFLLLQTAADYFSPFTIMADKITRIAIVDSNRCKPKRCAQECKKVREASPSS